MQPVELVRANKGAQKVSCTKALQAHCGLSLGDAKRATDALLRHEHPVVDLPSEGAARALIVALLGLGVVARFAAGPAYRPEERCATALALLAEGVQPAVNVTCESLAAHGEWEMAIAHGIAHLRDASTSGETFESLQRVAIEFGIDWHP
jgi:hypothetical protein